MKKKIILLLALFGIIFFILFLSFSKKKIYFSINGDSIIEIDVTEQYIDEGFQAKYCNKYFKFFCKDISNKVKIEKKQDKQDINTYYLFYSLKNNNHSVVLTRTIIKKDKENPIIKLENKNSYTCPNKKYEEEGYYAYDNVDGNITDKVLITEKNDKIYYSVFDSSNNKRIVYRDILYKDDENPKINLEGNDTIYVFLGNDFNEPGYNAFDNCDGDISNNVEIDSNFNKSKLGEYFINYTIKDSSNNSYTKSRKIIVYNDISRVEKNGKIIYLTFDDGPNKYTEDILLVLKKYNVKATFFVTHQFSGYDYLIKKSYDEGHSIGVHTYTHNFGMIYDSVDNYLKDFNNMNQIIYEQTGNYSKIFRFPGGSSNTISRFNKGIMSTLAEKMTSDGYKYFDWNVDSNDTTASSSDDIYKNVINEIQDKDVSVVLLHDIKKVNIESVDKIILYGLENGYTFLPIDDDTPLVQHKINN